MRGIFQLAPAIAIALGTPSHAQTNSTIRPSTDHSVTTGVGSSSTFKNVPPPDLPVPTTSGPAVVDPEAQQKSAEPDDARGSRVRGDATPAPSPAPEVREDPRTMITRDRIESPQH
jgi:hypothetical protein